MKICHEVHVPTMLPFYSYVALLCHSERRLRTMLPNIGTCELVIKIVGSSNCCKKPIVEAVAQANQNFRTGTEQGRCREGHLASHVAKQLRKLSLAHESGSMRGLYWNTDAIVFFFEPDADIMNCACTVKIICAHAHAVQT